MCVGVGSHPAHLCFIPTPTSRGRQRHSPSTRAATDCSPLVQSWKRPSTADKLAAPAARTWARVPSPAPAQSERACGEVFTVVSQVVHEAAALDAWVGGVASACRPPKARPSGCPSRENRGASLRPRPGEGRSLSQVCPHRCCRLAATPEDLRGRTSRPWRPLSQHQW